MAFRKDEAESKPTDVLFLGGGTTGGRHDFSFDMLAEQHGIDPNRISFVDTASKAKSEIEKYLTYDSDLSNNRFIYFVGRAAKDGEMTFEDGRRDSASGPDPTVTTVKLWDCTSGDSSDKVSEIQRVNICLLLSDTCQLVPENIDWVHRQLANQVFVKYTCTSARGMRHWINHIVMRRLTRSSSTDDAFATVLMLLPVPSPPSSSPSLSPLLLADPEESSEDPEYIRKTETLKEATKEREEPPVEVDVASIRPHTIHDSDSKPDTEIPEKPDFQEYLEGKPFEKPEDLTHGMQAELFSIEGVSDFGIAASSHRSPLVVNCSPAHKELAENKLKEFQTRYDVSMVVIWQDVKIRGLMDVGGTVNVDQGYKMNRVDHRGTALGLPVRFEGRRALLGMYHTLAAQVQAPDDGDIEERNVHFRFAAFHENDLRYLGTEAKGTVRQFNRNVAAVTGEVSLTFMTTWDDTEVRVNALPPTGVPPTNAPIDAAHRREIWEAGAVWKKGPTTGPTEGHVVYIAHSFRVIEPFENEQSFSDGVVVIHNDSDYHFAQPGDSSSVVYLKNTNGNYSLLGAVCAGKTETDQYGQSGVWTYKSRPLETSFAARHGNQRIGDLQWSKSVTYVLLYHNLFKLVQQHYGGNQEMPVPDM